SPPPNNGGTYRFVNSNTAVCSNAIGQTVTWRRDNTPLGQGIAPPALGPSDTPPEQPRIAPRAQPGKTPSPQSPGRNAEPTPMPRRGLAAEAPPDTTSFAPGSNYALVIGIDDYPAPLPKLKTAVNDARSFGALLNSKYG